MNKNPKDYKEKRIFITGANEGIGYNIAKELLLRRNYVAVLDIQTNNVKQFENEYPEHFLAIECDVRVEKSIIDAIDKCIFKFGYLDIVIHNACICTFDNFENTSDIIFLMWIIMGL